MTNPQEPKVPKHIVELVPGGLFQQTFRVNGQEVQLQYLLERIGTGTKLTINELGMSRQWVGHAWLVDPPAEAEGETGVSK